MPPLPNVPNVTKIEVICEGNDGRTAANVYHQVYSGSAPSSASCASAAELVWNAWVAGYTPTQPAQTSLTEVQVTDLSSDFGGQGSYTNGGTPVPGTSTHGMLPLHTCFLLSKFVARRYRGGHPRSYLPIGTTNDLNDDGDWKESSYAPWVTTWEDGIIAALVGVTIGGTSWAEECSVSYYMTDYSTTPPTRVRRTTPIVDDIPLDGYTGQPKLATQRRRVRRVARRR